ncbi:lachesin-like isoform X2 [Anthonomus grandis grandis]|uniref:lachesin-like isoform X2 n=1 Tax=Anthonomus grandis grandis TaxID=2921223 RepID=UPI00216654D6|nr:lachesin-like isoform X2 [Anthonomus grandis grandis]
MWCKIAHRRLSPPKEEHHGTWPVAWLRVDTQTILTIQNHVITKNHRIAVTQTEHRNWYLHIRDVRESDMGWYMCQINTDPMKSQMGYLNVVVPPDILDFPTSSDMVVREGSNVSLQCAAVGSPEPSITWRRENGEMIVTDKDIEVPYFEGPVLNMSKINRLQMGPYLCIASNGVPPSVSKRILLRIHFPPMIWIQNQLVGATIGEQITLECHSEAFPKSINYWTRDDDRIISQGTKYEPVFVDNTYKVHMRLTIHNVSQSDYGIYKCLAKNSLGDTDGTIKLYRIEAPTTKPTEKVLTQAALVTIKTAPKNMEKEKPSVYNLENMEVPNIKPKMIDDITILKDEFALAELQTIFPSSSSIKISAITALHIFPLLISICKDVII